MIILYTYYKLTPIFCCYEDYQMQKLLEDAQKIIAKQADDELIDAFKKSAIPVAVYYVSNRLAVDDRAAVIFAALFRLGVF